MSCAGSVGLELAAGKDGKAVGSEVGQYTVWHSRKLSLLTTVLAWKLGAHEG